MYNEKDTIYALATIKGKAGVAVIRVSGTKSKEVLKIICKKENLTPRMMTNTLFYDSEEIVDKGLVVFFENPKSFTGEDVLELHIHSSLAVIKRLSKVLGEIEGVRLADRGEFSRRAVMNNKMDLTEAEGLIDLINAETEFQRKIALKQYSGEQRKLFEEWKEDLTKSLAWIEAYLDFPEEEVSEDVTVSIQNLINKLSTAISTMLSTKSNGEAIRTGYKIAIIGKPNAGKSSLLNALTKRNVAIVSDIEGTTRDVIEAYIDLDGYPITFLDTAGIRNSEDIIEAEGVRRALEVAKDADLILYLKPISDFSTDDFEKDFNQSNVLKVLTKSDLPYMVMNDNSDRDDFIKCSVKAPHGVDNLMKAISEKISNDLSDINDTLLTRERHRQALKSCLDNLFGQRTIIYSH
ncbi:MAG: tRNA modification GTPase MnmE [Alphaproteobacteria bacterium ADurb.Bin438]|nr:MAG: tRNA modification GTPase MnmE [Alphaproteobacteria bacterium ADurb.Bin438]